MTPRQIADHPPDAPACGCGTPGEGALDRARARMRRTGQWNPSQAMGRRWPIGCVALEITQRCNLDCTLCYLSDSAEAVKDLPLQEVYRRIDQIFLTYGAGTNVQVTGGDPTLRKREELVAIVRRVASLGMRPSLFTNGIKATRDLLAELAEAGLVDVAFHVDLTQERKGFETEAALNAVRAAYIERARGLGVMVVFNTTIFDGNAHEVEGLARFFAANADVVGLASFQMQAETGRGALGGRQAELTPDALQDAIEQGLGCCLPTGAVRPGHAECNRYGIVLTCGGRTVPIVARDAFAGEMLEATIGLDPDRRAPARAAAQIARWLLRRPMLAARAVAWAAARAWALRAGLRHGRPRKLTFFIHNFMDARRLDPDRIEACVFAVAGANGMTPMCLHNARREAAILAPVRLETDEGARYWDPSTGETHAQPTSEPTPLTRKTARGARRLALKEAP